MTSLHPSIADLELPPLMQHLPRSRKGFPVPWFVAFIDGEPDFRIVKPNAADHCRKFGLCWLCGFELAAQAAYVAGPMCGINRTSGEPPSHVACARYAAKACPFLTRPHARRREEGMDGTVEPAGVFLRRNPGVAMVWISTSVMHPFWPGGYHEEAGAMLFDLPAPWKVEWYAEGREATFAEVAESIRTGIPALREAAAEDGPEAFRVLRERTKELLLLMPDAPRDEKIAAFANA